MSKSKTRWDSALKNNRAWLYYFQRLRKLAMARFKWEGLPDTINARYLEETLFYEGMSVFFQDDVTGNYLALKCAPEGRLQIYNEPTAVRAYSDGDTRFQTVIPADKCSIIYNTIDREADILNIAYFCDILWELDRTIKVNTTNQKTPYILLTTPQQKLSLQNLFQKVQGNEDLIFADKTIDLQGSVNTIPLNVPYVADKLMVQRKLYWCEALTYLGINNSPDSKKERQLVDEVNSNLEEIKANRVSSLEMRETACKEINKKFGLNVSVSFRDDIDTIADLDGGREDVYGDIHNAN